jgi:hypothetical protein
MVVSKWTQFQSSVPLYHLHSCLSAHSDST